VCVGEKSIVINLGIITGMAALRLFVLACAISAVAAWGEEGHAIIAQIASQLIADSTKKVMSEMLGGASMPSVASDADYYRDTVAGSWSGPLHYVNTERSETTIHLDVDCPNDVCVIEAIYNYTKRFSQDAQKNDYVCNLNYNDVEPCALVFLIHFVGDVHQPLHCGYGIDRGGNDIRVSWYGQITNLHSVWDVNIIQKWNSDYTSAATELLEMIKQNDPYTNTTDALAMGTESLYWVEHLVYDFTSTNLGDAYYDLSLPLVKERLAAAGVRLAAILDGNIHRFVKNNK